MAGVDPTGAFDPATFRTTIQAVMMMGMPEAASDQPTFRWVVPESYAVADPGGNTYDWTATPETSSSPQITDLQVDCAVDYSGSPTSASGTDAGEFNETTAKLTMLDVDHDALVAHGGRMPDQVLLAGATYNFDYITVEALYAVNVYTIYCTAEDQA